MSKTAVLPVIYILALCSGVFAAPAVYYYLYEYTAVSPKEAVILEMQSDNPTPPGSEFTPVTVEQLHEKGYQTPSEYAANAAVIDNVECIDWTASSWITTGTKNNGASKWVVCGSRTARNFVQGPGALFVACTTYSQEIAVPPRPRRIAYTREYSSWGYYTAITYYQEYAADRTIAWQQKGRHHIGNPRDMRYTQASVTH